MTTAPARPTLLGPNGQALDRVTPPPPVGDWQPVRAADNAVVWERPRVVPEPVVDDQAEQVREEAAATLADAQLQAGQIVEQARTEAEWIAAEAGSLRARTLASADHEAATIREDAAAAVARKDEAGKRLDVWMARAVIAGAVGLTATGEYSLARLAHFPQQVAWLLPFVIDVYVIQAFRRHRDILQAIGLTIAANVVYHLAAAGMFGVTTNAKGEHSATWWLIALVASIASVILWRMHVITAPPKVKEEPGTEAGTEPVQAATGTDTGTTSDVQESSPVPPSVAPLSTVPPGASEPVLGGSPVPPAGPVPQPARKPVQRGRGTAPRKPRRAVPSTVPKTGTAAGTASFDEHVATARGWLSDDPALSGTDIGKRLGTGDSYGRRVKRAALETAAS
ncbi:hypothetical protein OG693_39620 (plasmid) [Streptomyces sp. NBC_01259]|uniref:ATP synthase F0 subunit B n=1 Tax=Streptomyces sp. NBC_01259 TaxID=2903800 RepID=UPI00325625BC